MTAPALDPFDATGEATANLWQRLARPFDLPATVDALLGLSADVVEELAAVFVATCDEAERLLAQMPHTLRNLKTAIGSNHERCVGELRGPVQWSATVAAQGSSLGNRDVYVCALPHRAYDIHENQVLVGALRTVAAAGASLDRVADNSLEDDGMQQAHHNARLARRFLDHRTLEGIRLSGPPSARAIKRTRAGKHAASYRPALAMLERAGEPLTLADLAPYCDRRTKVQHGLLVSIIAELESRGLRVPHLRAEAASLFAGPVEYVHPRRRGDHSRVHGILIGNVLVDVPERLKERDREQTRIELESRAQGRKVVPVVDVSDVSLAVDQAILAARSS